MKMKHGTSLLLTEKHHEVLDHGKESDRNWNRIWPDCEMAESLGRQHLVDDIHDGIDL